MQAAEYSRRESAAHSADFRASKGVDEIINRFSWLELLVLDRQEIAGTPITNGLCMSGCVPTAPMATMLSSKAKVASSWGMALFSFSFAALRLSQFLRAVPFLLVWQASFPSPWIFPG